MLRVTTAAPPTPANVPARASSGTDAGPGAPGTLPTGLNTVFLVNRQQLAGQYGDTLAGSVISTLQSNLTALSNLGFPSAILSVDRYARCRPRTPRGTSARRSREGERGRCGDQHGRRPADPLTAERRRAQVPRARRRRPGLPVRAARRLHRDRERGRTTRRPSARTATSSRRCGSGTSSRTIRTAT